LEAIAIGKAAENFTPEADTIHQGESGCNETDRRLADSCLVSPFFKTYFHIPVSSHPEPTKSIVGQLARMHTDT